MTDGLTDEERIAISAVVHQNYYMPDVFAVAASLLAAARAEGAEKARAEVRERVESVADEFEHRARLASDGALNGIGSLYWQAFARQGSYERAASDLRAALAGGERDE